MNEIVLEVKDLTVCFRAREGLVRAVDGASYVLSKGRTLGLVGESGCGKTVSALAIMNLLDKPPAELHAGRILYDGRDLTQISEKEMQAVRGRSISMIFQEPMTSLNPVLSIGFQIAEVLSIHQFSNSKSVREKVIELLDMVGIASPDKLISEYPHQLSGGMRQRVMIAMALACDPKLLIADEPTTALDVTIQAQILDLMIHLQDRLGTSILLITHDFGVIAETAHEVAVMYAGKIVEIGDVRTIFHNPLHPYTDGLLRSIPRIDKFKKVNRLAEIPGSVPNLWNLPAGCYFYDRCSAKLDQCRTENPELRMINENHSVRCWRYL